MDAPPPVVELDPGLFSRARMVAVQPGSVEARAIESALETAAAAHVRASIEAAATRLTACLSAQGLSFEPDGEPGQLGFRAELPGGRVLSLVVTAGVGVSVRVRDAAELVADAAPSDAERRFHAALERARAAPGGFASLAEHERIVLALGGLEAEIANGGFEQYLRNSAGDHAHRVLEDLALIGAPAARRVVADAFRPFGREGPPPDREARIARMDTFPARQQAAWDRLSAQYFARGEFVPGLADAHFLRTVPGWGAGAVGGPGG